MFFLICLYERLGKIVSGSLQNALEPGLKDISILRKMELEIIAERLAALPLRSGRCRLPEWNTAHTAIHSESSGLVLNIF